MKKSMKPSAGPKEAMAPKKTGPEDYEVESAVHHLTRAQEIQNDPEMMKHVNKHLGKKMKSLKDLKAMAGQKALEEQDDSGSM